MIYAEFRNLETERLLLRKLSMDDLYDYYESIGSDGDVSRFLMWEPHQDIGETLASFEKALRRHEEGGFYRWTVERKADGAQLGVVQLLRFEEETSTCSFTYFFAKAYWNRGYATEAMEAVLGFAFDEMGIRRIEAEHFTQNAASGAVMRKLGMKHIATVPGKYEKLGRSYDVEVYELIHQDREPLTAAEYQRQAMLTLNPALSKSDVLLNGVMGLCGEAGEAIDIVKKHLHQGHDLDKEKLVKELGDVAWYLAETAYALDIPLEEVLRRNIEKLKQRYPQGFSRENSLNR